MDVKAFVEKAHEGQVYAGHPFTYHLEAVASRARQYRDLIDSSLWDTVETAAYLHDVLEDTSTTPEDLRALFGPDVVEIVENVTDKLPDQPRRIRHRATYPVIAGHLPSLYVKLCDRLANVEQAHGDRAPILAMYRKEHAYFREVLFEAGRAFMPMWDRLAELLSDESGESTR